MKKQILVLATAFVMTVTTAFGTGTKPVPDAIADAFKKEFRHTGDVQWKTTSNFYKASFSVAGQALEAFYDLNGKLIGLSRSLLPEQLPMSLTREAMAKSATSNISELFELLTDNGTEYFITYINEKESTTYKSDGNAWVRY